MRHVASAGVLQGRKRVVAGMDAWIRSIAGAGRRQTKARLVHLGQLLRVDAGADGWAVRRASAVVALGVVGDAERSNAEDLLIETAVRRSLQGRVATVVVERVRTNEVGRWGDG